MSRRGILPTILFLTALLFQQTATAADEKRVLMVLWKGETNAEKAFKEKLSQLGYSVTYTEVNADQNRTTLAEQLRKIEGDLNTKNYDLIYTYGTVGTKVTMEIVREAVPIVFNIVYDPVGGALVESLERPGRNVTGVTNGVPVADQFAQFQKYGRIAKLGVLFNARETNSNILERDVAAWATANNVELISIRVSNDDAVLHSKLDELKAQGVKIDALYAGADNYLASKAKDIHERLGGDIRLFGGTQTYIWSKWLAAYTPLVTDMGETAAEQADRIFKGGDPRTLPVVLPKPKLFSHKEALDHFGLPLPEGAQLETR